MTDGLPTATARGLLLALLAITAVAAEAAAPLPGGTGDPVATAALARLPVLHQGRVKPYAVAADEVVTSITSRASFALTVDHDGKRMPGRQKYPAQRLLTDWMAQPGAWRDQPLAWVPFLALRTDLHLPGEWASLGELTAQNGILAAAQMKKQRMDSSGARIDWTAEDEAALQTGGRAGELDDALGGLAISLLPLVWDDATTSWAIDRAWPLAHKDKAGGGRPWRAALGRALAGDPERRAESLRLADPWLSAADVVWDPDPLLAGDGSPYAPALAAGAQLRAAWLAGDGPRVAAAAQALTTALRSAGTARVAWQTAHGATHVAEYPTAGRIAWELDYQRWRPFLWAGVLFVAGGLLAGAALATGGRGRLWKLGVACTVIACLACAYGLGARGLISGWGMVTNLYETLVYVSFLCGVLGLVLAFVTRRPAYVVAAALGAALCALVGEMTPPDLGRHIGQLQPVLRSHLWLTVHVLIVVASYAPFLLAWALGNWYLARAGLGGRKVAADESQAIYRCLQVGVVLIAAGTLLGGVWADQAWGRFWGWDPKEVWALMILLTYLIPLHLRYVGMVGPTGIAAWAIYGFMSVVMSWYGVNFVLGAGLHAYATGSGFGSGGQLIVLPLCALQIGLAIWWQLSAAAAAAPPKPPAAPAPEAG